MSGSDSLAQRLSLDGRIALVTGASGGIGRKVVSLLASAGARVAAVDRPGSTPGTGAELTLEADLANPAEVRRVASEVNERLGGIDHVIHAAGITRDGVLWKLTEEDWDDVIAVNLSSGFHLLKATIPILRARGGGSIVLFASINGERGHFGQANYAASKAGVIALTRCTAKEVGRFNIRVNAVSPGYIHSPMTEGLPPELLQMAVDETALGRMGEPRHVADAVLFLCSSLSEHITGQVLRIDGGQLMV
ncbi:MAG: SDR family oxidoreductase [Planctomycetota bacterium]